MKKRLMSISILTALCMNSVVYANDSVSVVTDPTELRAITDNYRSDANRPKDFIPQDDGTVVDKRTGLQWMRCALGQEWTGKKCIGTAKEYTYQQAQKIKESFAGYDDWRLPTRFELETLIYCSSGKDKGRTNAFKDMLPHYLKACGVKSQSPALVQESFSNSAVWFFWSASPSLNNENRAWSVEFEGGSDYNTNKDEPNNVRLVRNSK